MERLDAVARPVAKAVARAVAQRNVKDLLSGSWLGHPLHPMLTDVPIGAWTSAFVLDLLGGRRAQAAADQLVGLGVVAALPTAASGLSDWSDFLGAERRVGAVHAVTNVAAVACYGLSYLARRRGDRSRGLALSLLGAAAATVGGYLGGHLTYAQGANVNRNAWQEDVGDWTAADQGAELPVTGAVTVRLGETDVLLARHDGTVHAIADRCGHAGGPLHEGKLEGGCVTCPWHGSTFRLDDGGVVHGPATVPQPSFDVRTEADRILLRSAHQAAD